MSPDKIYEAIQEIQLDVREVKVKLEERHIETTKKIDNLFDMAIVVKRSRYPSNYYYKIHL